MKQADVECQYRFPAEEVDEFIRSDSKFRFEPTGGVHTPWSEAGDGHWFQKLRCHLDFVNFASLFGLVLFYNPGIVPLPRQELDNR